MDGSSIAALQFDDEFEREVVLRVAAGPRRHQKLVHDFLKAVEDFETGRKAGYIYDPEYRMTITLSAFVAKSEIIVRIVSWLKTRRTVERRQVQEFISGYGKAPRTAERFFQENLVDTGVLRKVKAGLYTLNQAWIKKTEGEIQEAFLNGA